MASTADKIKGTADVALGKIEKGIGETIDSEDWTIAGRMNEEKGQEERAKGEQAEEQEKAVEEDLIGAETEGAEEEKRRDLDIDLHPGMNN